MTRNKVLAGRMLNAESVIRSLKQKGFYRSGVPRSEGRTSRRRPLSRRRPTGLSDTEFYEYLKTLDEREERRKK